MGLAQCVSSAATQVFGEQLGAGALFGTAQVIANGRGQGSSGQTGTVVGKCSAVQLAEESGRAGSLRPATPVSPSTAVRRRS
jgi:hypothetical protein